MTIDSDRLSRYRRISSFRAIGSGSDYERNAVLKQAIQEFDWYQKYSPNTHRVYINGAKTPILATFIDVSDLEVTTDSKWMLTSLKNDIRVGDSILWGNRMWMCIYDKEKNTANCYKTKVQPCNFPLKIAVYEDVDNKANPIVYTHNSIVLTYLTDTRNTKQVLPTESGSTYISMKYDKYSRQIKSGNRLWIHGKPFSVVGEDYTNVDFYTGYGIVKFTTRPDTIANGSDNIELGVCDYYKFFPQESVPPVQPVVDIETNITNTNISVYDKITINAQSTQYSEFEFVFVGDMNACVLSINSSTSATLKVGKNIGYVTVRIKSVSNPDVYKDIKFLIR